MRVVQRGRPRPGFRGAGRTFRPESYVYHPLNLCKARAVNWGLHLRFYFVVYSPLWRKFFSSKFLIFKEWQSTCCGKRKFFYYYFYSKHCVAFAGATCERQGEAATGIPCLRSRLCSRNAEEGCAGHHTCMVNNARTR